MFSTSDFTGDINLDKAMVQDGFMNVHGHRDKVKTDFDRMDQHGKLDSNEEKSPEDTETLIKETKGNDENKIEERKTEQLEQDEEDKEKRHMQIEQPHDDNSPGEWICERGGNGGGGKGGGGRSGGERGEGYKTYVESGNGIVRGLGVESHWG